MARLILKNKELVCKEDQLWNKIKMRSQDTKLHTYNSSRFLCLIKK